MPDDLDILRRLARYAHRLRLTCHDAQARLVEDADAEIRQFRSDNVALRAQVAQADGVAEVARGTIQELRSRVAELEGAEGEDGGVYLGTDGRLMRAAPGGSPLVPGAALVPLSAPDAGPVARGGDEIDQEA